MTSARFYFTDIRTGAELADHPLNGCAAEGTGSWVVHEGDYVKGHRTEIYTYGRRGEPRRKITSADFGGRCVRVKFWAPNPEVRSEFVLVPETWTPRPAKR